MGTIKIRRAAVEDANALYELAKQYVTGRDPITRSEFKVAFTGVLVPRDNETNVLFVAEDASGIVIGYSLMTVSRLLHAAGLTAHLQELLVSENVRGKGVGDMLVHANERYCVRRGVRQLSAYTNHIGSFYAHRDFEQVGTHYRKLLPLE